MLDQELIQYTRSPWNSILYLVPKLEGQYRPAMDIRKVNEVAEDKGTLCQF